MGQKANNGYVDILCAHPYVTGSSFHGITHIPNGEVSEFLTDCGLFQEEPCLSRNEKLNFNPCKISNVFLTHAHADHLGRIPMLYKQGYTHMVHTTSLTQDLMRIALKNSAKVLADTAKAQRKQPIYAISDVDKTMNNVIGYDYNKRININKNMLVTFLGNGHIFGASSILLRVKLLNGNYVNILFTGDYATDNIFFDVPEYPKEIYDLPLIVFQEATYGDSFSWEKKPVLKDNVANAIKDGKDILFPAFSLGRYQEIMHLVRTWQNEGIIPNFVKIILDGSLPLEYNQLFRKNKMLLKPDVKIFTPRNCVKASKMILKDDIINDPTQKIIISSSGMGTYGPSSEYIEKMLPRKNVLIHFLGYMAEGTYGRKLQDTPTGELVILRDGRLIQKNAQVEFTNELSAHAKADELLDYLKKFNNIKFLGINHGEPLKTQAYASYVKKNTNIKDVFVLNDKTTYRFNEYGLVKSFTNQIEYY